MATIPYQLERAQMTWFEAALDKYQWIWVGLSAGFAAKYALQVKQGIPVRARFIIADILLLPLVALLSYEMVVRTGVDTEAAALITAFCTVTADRLIKLMTERFFKKVEAVTVADLHHQVVERKGDLRNTLQTVKSAERLLGEGEK